MKTGTAAALALVPLIVFACKTTTTETAPLTEIKVAIDSDLDVPLQVDGIRLQAQAWDKTTERPKGEPNAEINLQLVKKETDLPITLGLIAGGDPNGEVRLKIGAYLGSNLISARTATMQFVEGQVRSYTLRLDKDCLGVTCVATGKNAAGTEDVCALGYVPGALASEGNLAGSTGDCTCNKGECRLTDVDPDAPGSKFPLPNGTPDVPGTDIASFSLGETHACAVTTNSVVFCWGDNADGQTGDPTGTAGLAEPRVVPNLAGVFAVDASVDFTCALVAPRTDAGATVTGSVDHPAEVYCWGLNDTAQLGASTLPKSAAPVKVPLPDGVTPVLVDASKGHACVVTADKSIYCWGANDFGQSGNGKVGAPVTTPQKVLFSDGVPLTGALAVDLGETHTCAIVATGAATTGAVYCWGDNSKGGVGQAAAGDAGAVAVFPYATVVPGATDASHMDSGAYHTCAVVAHETALMCWGNDDRGQIGNGLTEVSAVAQPFTVPFPAGFPAIKQVACGEVHTCVVNDQREVWCWGGNSNGQLGHGPADNTPAGAVLKPTIVAGNATGQTIETAMFGTCVHKDGGEIRCWGLNDFGQLGIPTLGNVTTPTQVTGLP